MKGIFIAVFLGMFGGYRFYKKQKTTGFIYLFTFGLCLFGWAFDIIQAVLEYLKTRSKKPTFYIDAINQNPDGFKGEEVIETDIAGSFAECKKDPMVKRSSVIDSLEVGSRLSIETAYYNGTPYFLVSVPGGLDIGAFPHDLSAFIKENCPDAHLSAVLTNKDVLEQPRMVVTIKR